MTDASIAADDDRAIPIAVAVEMAHSVPQLVSALGAAARDADLSVTAAESCTGGMLCGAIVSDSHASSILERGFVVYSVDAKCELLGLDRQEVEACTGVSEGVARALASSALRESRADIALAITGFAGPGDAEEETGLVHVAAARGDVVLHREVHFGDIGRTLVMQASMALALELGLKLAAR